MAGMRRGTFLHVEDRDVYCRNGCQFYGNPEWEGFCSKCYKLIRQQQQQQQQQQHQQQQQQQQQQQYPQHFATAPAGGKAQPPSRHHHHGQSDARPPSAATVSGDFFGRFEEKKSRQKEQQKGSKTFKNFMKRANTLKETTTFSLSSGWNGPQLRDKKAAEGLLVLREELYRKLALPKDLCLEVVRILNGALEKMETLFKKHEKMSIVSDMVQDVYQLIYDRCAAVQDTESSASEAVELCEDFLISHTYDVLFGVLSSEEECRDLSVLQRIRSLHWVRAHHLELDVNDIHPTVKEFMDEAMKQLIIIDSKRSPKEKLACVVDAAKNIFRMLQACPVGPSHLGADDLLPAMIYVVLRANPPRLHTNIRLVTLFSAQTRLRSGEGGYMFTNLCGAVHFIENLTASELQMPPEEFESYISGKAVPPEDAATEGVRQMYHNMAALKELNLRQDRLADASEQLKVTLDSLQKDIREQVQRALERTEDATRPHEYRVPRHVPPRCLPAFLRDKVIRTDSPQSPPQPPDLPAPLQPELLHDNTCQSDDNDDSNSNTKSIIKTNNNNDNNNGDISVDNNHVVGDDQKTDLLDGSSVSTTLNMDDVGNVSNTDNNNSNNDSSNNNDNSNDNNKNSSGDSNETKVTSSAIEDDELQVEEDKPEPVTEPAEVAGEVQAGIETSTAAADDSAP